MLANSAIESCVRWACEQEVNAPKPGNVNPLSDGHNMVIEDFLASATAIAPVMAAPDLTVGQRILQSIKATRQVVNCNTNLGIVLLFAPLCQAIRTCNDFSDLPEHLSAILQNLTVADARDCYQAIRLAEAGGLGHSHEQDINTEPTVTLRQTMEIASQRDTIAQQYVNNYNEIFHIGLPILTSEVKSGAGVEWATTFAYLNLLSSVPDTLICRKQSREHASAVTEKAKLFVVDMKKNNKLKALKTKLIAWDNELKKKALNPGTTADMTAASLLVFAFQQALSLNEFQYHEAYSGRH